MIRAERISFGYQRGGVVTLHNVNAQINPGIMTAITGPSGVGKSTLLYILGAMLAPTSGRVSIQDQDISHLSDRQRALLRSSKIGFIFQDAALDQRRSILANVLEGALYSDVRSTGARGRAMALLDQFCPEVEVDRRSVALSGGQAQRIGLCRALLGNPPILLADEPTGNLDSDNSELLEKALRDHAAAGNVVVVVTHDDALASRCEARVQLHAAS